MAMIGGYRLRCRDARMVRPDAPAAVSVITVTWSPHHKCNQQTGFRAVEVEIGQAPEMVKSRSPIAERDVSVLQAFGVMKWNYPRWYAGRSVEILSHHLPVFPRNRQPAINKDSVLQAVWLAYAREYDEETTETADFGSYEVKRQ